jgi:hypothetical protein
MPKQSNTFDEELQEQLTFLGFLTAEQRRCVPDWMVVAPPKTGTSWVYANLRQHPEAFAVDLKELKYFSNRFELEDLCNYLAHFRSGVGKTKGEASPSYSLLPCRTIRLIRALVPDLKLIYLMREPISRAWSHARHNFREQEATFKGYSGGLDTVSDEHWIECVTDDWNRLSGDYLGQLQRWLSVFPREQVYLGFFEEIVHSPRRLLREMLEFLEIDPAFADSEDVILERVNIGVPKDLPPRVHQHLAAIHVERTRELAEYLHDEHGMTVPLEWADTLSPAIPWGNAGEERPVVVSWQADDDALSKLLTRDDLLERDFLGFHILRRGTSFVAYPMSLGNVNPEYYGPQWWTEQLAAGNCLVAANPYDLKSLIVRKCLARDAAGSEIARLRHLEHQFVQVEDRQAGLQSSVGDVTEQLRNIERSQAASSECCAGLSQSHADIVERVNSLRSAQAQVVEDLQSARREHQQLAEGFRALERGHRELVEYSLSLRRSHDELMQTRDILLRSRDELIQSRDELVRSRDELVLRLAQSNDRLQKAEDERFDLRARVVALENSLVFRTVRRIDSWLLSLRVIRRQPPVDDRLHGSIDVPTGDHNQKTRMQTPVAEKSAF